MRARRMVRPFFGLTLFTGIAVVIVVAYMFGNAGIHEYLRGFSDSRLDVSTSGQRILNLTLAATVTPPDTTNPQGTISATADLHFEIVDTSRNSFVCLLNPGLTITSAEVHGTAVRWIRNGRVVTLNASDPLPIGTPVTVHLEYGGRLSGDAYMPATIGGDRVILPHLSLWHPVDLNSFFPIQATVDVPSGWVPALDNVAIKPNGNRQQVTWKEDRPVLGSTFIAGPYEHRAQRHGNVRCTYFYVDDGTANPTPIIDAMGSAYSYLRTMFGSDDFDRVCAVSDPNIAAGFNGGNAVLGFPSKFPSESRDQFALLAREIACNWWGNTVTGRWFARQPEATSWLDQGFAEYSAWLTLRGVKGKSDALRYLETLHCPPSIDFPMKMIAIADAYREPVPGTATDPLYIYVRQPYTLSVLAAETGEERFLAGCKNLLRIHRYRSISYIAALQELELASESDLRETFRVWFERDGTFDYAVDDVSQDNDAVRISISNPGDIPVFGNMTVALITADGVVTRAIEPGANGGSFLFQVHAPVATVILDPEFVLPDMRRANNIWPRRTVPRLVHAGTGGNAVLTASTNPVLPGADAIAVASGDLRYADRIDTPAPLETQPLPDPRNESVLFKAGKVFIWDHESGNAVAIAGETFIPLGWVGEEAVLQDPARNTWYTRAGNGPLRALGTGHAIANPGSLIAQPGQKRAAYVDEPTGAIRIVTLAPFADEAVNAPPSARNVVWTTDGSALIFANPAGTVVRLNPVTGDQRVLLHLDYALRKAEVSPGGVCVAWLDPKEQLRYCAITRPLPQPAQVVGVAVSFTWIDDATLLVLAAEPLREIPALAYAKYSLWRVYPDGRPPECVLPDATRLF